MPSETELTKTNDKITLKQGKTKSILEIDGTIISLFNSMFLFSQHLK